MGFVDQGLLVRRPGWRVVVPVEPSSHDNPTHGERCRVTQVGEAGALGVERGQRRVVDDCAVEHQRIRVGQEFRRIAPEPARRVPRAVDAIAVSCAGPQPNQADMPDVAVNFGHRYLRLGPVLVEKAQVYRLRDFGEDREVGAETIECRAEWHP